MSGHIPTEIIIEILFRLPVKSILRYTLVCKLWYSLITNPNFITTHLNRFVRTTTDQLLLRLYKFDEKKEHYFILPNEGIFDESYKELDFPFDISKGYFRIIDSCNGLICLCDDNYQDAEEVIVWNPCIRKSVTVTLPKKPQYPYMCVIGFGFDLEKSVFKIVRIIYEKECLNQCKVPPEVEVYEQGGEGWRGIECALLQYSMVEFIWSQVFLHKSVHWVAFDPSIVGVIHNVIVAFEIGDEVFKKIELPTDLASQESAYLSVNLFKDSLAVLSQSGSGACSVWEMRDYGVFESWTNLYNIVLPGVFRALGFRTNGDLLLTSKTGAVISYDDGTTTITTTSIQGSPYSLKVQHFAESLVLLKGEKDLPDCFPNFF